MTAIANPTIEYEDALAASASARRHLSPHLCAACGSRPARYQYRGVVRADRSHTLCFQCYRSTMNSVRNVELLEQPIAWTRASRVPAAVEHVLRRSQPAEHRPARGTAASLQADKYEELARRRRRAQIAARHALGPELT